MPARLSLTPVAMPPNPAPTTTTFGVPAGPNSCSAVDVTSRSLRAGPRRPRRLGGGAERLTLGEAVVDREVQRDLVHLRLRDVARVQRRGDVRLDRDRRVADRGARQRDQAAIAP